MCLLKRSPPLRDSDRQLEPSRLWNLNGIVTYLEQANMAEGMMHSEPSALILYILFGSLWNPMPKCKHLLAPVWTRREHRCRHRLFYQDRCAFLQLMWQLSFRPQEARPRWEQPTCWSWESWVKELSLVWVTEFCCQ